MILQRLAWKKITLKSSSTGVKRASNPVGGNTLGAFLFTGICVGIGFHRWTEFSVNVSRSFISNRGNTTIAYTQTRLFDHIRRRWRADRLTIIDIISDFVGRLEHVVTLSRGNIIPADVVFSPDVCTTKCRRYLALCKTFFTHLTNDL